MIRIVTVMAKTDCGQMRPPHKGPFQDHFNGPENKVKNTAFSYELYDKYFHNKYLKKYRGCDEPFIIQ